MRDGVSGGVGADVLAAGEYATDGACTADGRLRERQAELRFAKVVVCPRADLESVALLDAQDDFQAPTGWFQDFRTQCAWISDQRGGAYRR